VSDFIKDLAKLRKPLQQKLKKEASWVWTSNDTKIVHFKKICKKLPILNLLNEEGDLIIEKMAAMSTGVQSSK